MGASIRASAWRGDPIGDGKTAIRAGAGIGHDFINQELHLNTSSSLPFRLTVVQTGLINLDFPYPQGDPFPYNYNPEKSSVADPVPGALPGEYLPADFPARSFEHEDARAIFLEPGRAAANYAELVRRGDVSWNSYHSRLECGGTQSRRLHCWKLRGRGLRPDGAGSLYDEYQPQQHTRAPGSEPGEPDSEPVG